MFYGVAFYNIHLNSFNISCLFSGGINISATFHKLISDVGFCFTSLSGILFPMSYPIASAVFGTSF